MCHRKYMLLYCSYPRHMYPPPHMTHTCHCITHMTLVSSSSYDTHMLLYYSYPRPRTHTHTHTHPYIQGTQMLHHTRTPTYTHIHPHTHTHTHTRTRTHGRRERARESLSLSLSHTQTHTHTRQGLLIKLQSRRDLVSDGHHILTQILKSQCPDI
jgi:hypothetical protein